MFCYFLSKSYDDCSRYYIISNMAFYFPVYDSDSPTTVHHDERKESWRSHGFIVCLHIRCCICCKYNSKIKKPSLNIALRIQSLKIIKILIFQFYSTKPLWDKNSPEYKQLRSEIEATKRDEEVKNGELIDPNVTTEDEKL
ncbi:Schizosaccharomyces pombe specific protein [Schizosaccharomyces pombe]|uniref:Putative uncharacterized protein C23C4.04c n=1 Tax=Schizosaccharomyces pombe (strain 972 / ATCC 24843) TaxID=284812 RepID=YF64_SCHPO|nr:uncharacterized protein SPAC23C4.04c [Schizosaccharomyces pombe]A6X970.2 RecName: Full=Putative uncharacterized protein C23C4.04c [Schizosaccharomyces pombe 972h-]CAO77637.2 sequence orphan [Schizosaccharomyces pombe]|eukprot:NP_001343030.1 uncharacterized protein SPAC23C4.04c [Schizosaccharomyces pombe]